ncbi:hypothetical protein KC325_g152 [Hortaea werneckii]|nr:hypothetical protein KC325_g152 [Hortaea werneckii]
MKRTLTAVAVGRMSVSSNSLSTTCRALDLQSAQSLEAARLCTSNQQLKHLLGCALALVCVSRNVLLNDVSVLPAELVAQSADGAVLLARPQAEHTECLGDHHPLLAVHATDGAPEHLGRLAVVPGTTTRSIETDSVLVNVQVLERSVSDCSQRTTTIFWPLSSYVPS